MFEYPCRMIRIINGNTVEADIDLGFGIHIEQNIRLYGVADTPESMTALIKTLGREFVCKTIYNKRGKIGRVLGILYNQDEHGNLINVNEAMIAQGFEKKLNT